MCGVKTKRRGDSVGSKRRGEGGYSCSESNYKIVKIESQLMCKISTFFVPDIISRPLTTRLETRTKESNTCARLRVSNV